MSLSWCLFMFFFFILALKQSKSTLTELTLFSTSFSFCSDSIKSACSLFKTWIWSYLLFLWSVLLHRQKGWDQTGAEKQAPAVLHSLPVGTFSTSLLWLSSDWSLTPWLIPEGFLVHIKLTHDTFKRKSTLWLKTEVFESTSRTIWFI